MIYVRECREKRHIFLFSVAFSFFLPIFLLVSFYKLLVLQLLLTLWLPLLGSRLQCPHWWSSQKYILEGVLHHREKKKKIKRKRDSAGQMHVILQHALILGEGVLTTKHTPGYALGPHCPHSQPLKAGIRFQGYFATMCPGSDSMLGFLFLAGFPLALSGSIPPLYFFCHYCSQLR